MQALLIPPRAHEQEAEGILDGKAQHGKDPAQNAWDRERIERQLLHGD